MFDIVFQYMIERANTISSLKLCVVKSTILFLEPLGWRLLGALLKYVGNVLHKSYLSYYVGGICDSMLCF